MFPDGPVMEPALFGPYVLVEQLGRGGMAEVFRARSIGAAGFSRDVAIKRILPAYANDDEFVAMFVDEARTMSSLSHPNIVQVYDLGKLDDYYFMAMEFVFGHDLLELLANSSRRRRRLPREIVLHIVGETLKGLSRVHSAADVYGRPLHIVHRDISPSNILLGYDGSVKIGDFGIAKSRLQSRRTEVGTQKGKLGYMSPEQARGEALDARSDLFSVGVLLFECLTMSRLFKGDDEARAAELITQAEIEPALANRMSFLDERTLPVLRRALTRSPEDRYPNAESFLHDIEEIQRVEGHTRGNEHLDDLMRDIFAEQLERGLAYRRGEEPRIRELLSPGSTDTNTYEFRVDGGPPEGPVTSIELERIALDIGDPDRLELRVPGDSFRPIDTYRELLSLVRRMRADSPVHSRAPETGHRQSMATPSLGTGAIDPDSAPPEATGGHRVPRDAQEVSAPPTAGARQVRPLPTARRSPAQPASAPARPEPSPHGAPAGVPVGRTESFSSAAGLVCGGSLRTASFPRLLHRIAFGRHTGTLTITCNGAEREVHFREGTIVQASTLSVEERLGAVALAHGYVDEQTLERALATSRAEDARLGNILMQHHGLSPHALYEICLAQLQDKLWPYFSATVGNWAWHGRATDHLADISVPIPTLPFALSGVREHTPDAAKALFYRAWEQSPLRQGVRKHDAPGAGLTAPELRVLQRLQPGDTPNALMSRVARTLEQEHNAMHALYVGCELGFIQLPDRAELPRPLGGAKGANGTPDR